MLSVCICAKISYYSTIRLCYMNIQLQTTFTFFFNHKPSCAHPPQQQHTLHTHVAVSTCTVYVSDTNKHSEKLFGQQKPEWPIFYYFSLMSVIKRARGINISALSSGRLRYFSLTRLTRGVLFCPAATSIICEFRKIENLTDGMLKIWAAGRLWFQGECLLNDSAKVFKLSFV